MPFNVFLSHSSTDKPAVEELARRLAKEGIQAWLDKWHLIPGDSWQPAIEKALAESETCAVFVGPSGFGPWQNEEMRAAIDQRVRDSDRRFRVIPVLLPGARRAERSSLPTFLVATTWVEFSNSLDDPAAFHRLVSGIRGLEPGAGPGQAIYEGQSPYRGLRVFDVDDAPFFFGREALVQWLLNELRPATEGKPVNRFLGIVGASGGGKSSVARAGLVAALKHDAIPGSARWPVAIFRPGLDPLESLAVAISRTVNTGQGAPALAELIAEFEKNEKTLHLVSRQSLPENAPDMQLVVVVDQFEEVFTLCRKQELCEALVRNLLYAAKVAQGQTLVILTMRADFYGKCAANAELAAAFSDHHVLVGPMTDDELRRAIERPTQLVGCELEAGLVDLLVQDVLHQPGALPLLQHALLELWNKREGRRLTVKAYQQIGKLEGALQRRADATLEAFTKDEQELCRRTFLRLTQPGEGTEDTKRRAAMQELLSLSGKSSAEEAIIQKLADASLLTTEGDLRRGDAFVEVAHEALIRNWPQLRTWIDADRAGLRTRTRLSESARDWEKSGRDPTYLYSGARLAVAEEWAAPHPGELSTDEAEFLRNSRDVQSQREASEREVARRLAESRADKENMEKIQEAGKRGMLTGVMAGISWSATCGLIIAILVNWVIDPMSDSPWYFQLSLYFGVTIPFGFAIGAVFGRGVARRTVRFQIHNGHVSWFWGAFSSKLWGLALVLAYLVLGIYFAKVETLLWPGVKRRFEFWEEMTALTALAILTVIFLWVLLPSAAKLGRRCFRLSAPITEILGWAAASGLAYWAIVFLMPGLLLGSILLRAKGETSKEVWLVILVALFFTSYFFDFLFFVATFTMAQISAGLSGTSQLHMGSRFSRRFIVATLAAGIISLWGYGLAIPSWRDTFRSMKQRWESNARSLRPAKLATLTNRCCTLSNSLQLQLTALQTH